MASLRTDLSETEILRPRLRMTKRGELPTAERGGNPEAIAGDYHDPTAQVWQ